MEKLFIFKFGGSCFKDNSSLKNTITIINEFQKQAKIVIVTSAFQGITDKLIEWMEFTKSDRTIEESLEKLKSIQNFHEDILNKTIKNLSIKQEVLKFINEKFEELKHCIPILIEKVDTAKDKDFILSYGERLSTFIFAKYLESMNIASEFISADDNFIITDNNFGNSLPILKRIEHSIPSRLIKILERKKIPVITGYYAISEDNFVTTLGRGGSDFSATIIAYSISEYYDTTIIFWKDVSGLLSAPPKFEPHAKLIKYLSFKEAKELAFFGSKILHPLCLNLAEKKKIKVQIRNFEDPFNDEFTTITTEKIENGYIIKAITALENIAMVTIEGESMVSLPGVAAKIFSLIAENNININFISQSSSENNITFGVSESDGFKVGDVLANSDYFGTRWLKVKVDYDVSLVAVVGEGMQYRKGVAGKVFTTLGDAEVNIIAISQGSSELNITFVIKREDLKNAIQSIYHKLIKMNEKTNHK